MDFDERQLTEYSRYRAGITAHEIVAVDDGSFTVLRKKGKEMVMERIATNRAYKFTIGQFVDLLVISTFSNGRETSYTIQFIGLTPPQFAKKP